MVEYHQRTMHRTSGFARALGYLDWASQPDPFRRYGSATLIGLDHPEPVEPRPRLDDLARPGHIEPRPTDRSSISQLFYDSLALSAWKQQGRSRWSLRVNPSSGNLHPTEGYLLCDTVDGIDTGPGLYHYAPYSHSLEPRFALSTAEWAALTAGLPAGSLLVGLTSIHWRESWKYGERAYRYCQHDAGHAIAALALAAAALGWSTQLVQGLGDAELARLLCVHHQRGIEAEHPDVLLALHRHDRPADPTRMRAFTVPRVLLERIERESTTGTPNQLSSNHHEWPVIDEVAAACRWPAGDCSGRSHCALNIMGTKPSGTDAGNWSAATGVISPTAGNCTTWTPTALNPVTCPPGIR